MHILLAPVLLAYTMIARQGGASISERIRRLRRKCTDDENVVQPAAAGVDAAGGALNLEMDSTDHDHIDAASVKNSNINCGNDNGVRQEKGRHKCPQIQDVHFNNQAVEQSSTGRIFDGSGGASGNPEANQQSKIMPREECNDNAEKLKPATYKDINNADKMEMSRSTRNKSKNYSNNGYNVSATSSKEHVRVNLRHDIVTILQNAGMTMPTFTNDPIVKVPSWTVDNTREKHEKGEDIGARTKRNKKHKLNVFTPQPESEMSPRVADSVKSHTKTNNVDRHNENPEVKTKHSIVHIEHSEQKGPIEESLKKITAADVDPSANQQDKNKTEVGIFMLLLSAVALLCVAVASFRQHQERQASRSSQLFSSIEGDQKYDDEFSGTELGTFEDYDGNTDEPSYIFWPSLSPTEWTLAPYSLWPLQELSPSPSDERTLVPSLTWSLEEATEDWSTTPFSTWPTDIASSALPSPAPTNQNVQVGFPVTPNNLEVKTVVFAAIGDVPYTNWEARKLKEQMDDLNEAAEFLIHVGDMRSAANRDACTLEEYEEVADILLRSRVPVFIILGDNDWYVPPFLTRACRTDFL